MLDSHTCRQHCSWGHVPYRTCTRRGKPSLLSFNSRVSVVGLGYIKLERDLPYNVSTAWKPVLHTFECECTALPFC